MNPPPDMAPGHAERAQITDRILDDTAQTPVKLATCCGIEEEVVTEYLLVLKSHVQVLIVKIGMLIPCSVLLVKVV